MYSCLVADMCLFFLCRYPLAGSKLQESASTFRFSSSSSSAIFLKISQAMKVFLATWTSGFSSFLQGSPSGRLVILLINSGVSYMVRPLKLTVAWVFEWGFKDNKNSSVTSSSYPWILSKKDIQFTLVKRTTTSGCSCNLLDFKGSFLVKPPGMVFSDLWKCLGEEEGNNFQN